MATIRKLRDLWSNGISKVRGKRRQRLLSRRTRPLLLESLERRDLLSITAAFTENVNASIDEDSGDRVNLTVELSEALPVEAYSPTVTVQLLSEYSTGTSSDFVWDPGTFALSSDELVLELEPGKQLFSFDVLPNDAGYPEGDRTIVLGIIGGSYWDTVNSTNIDISVGSPSTAAITIVDDESHIEVTGNTKLNEGDVFSGTLSLPDSGESQSPWQTRVDYGDGTDEVFSLSEPQFYLEHIYANDGDFTVT